MDRVEGGECKWDVLADVSGILLWQTVGGSSIMKGIGNGGADYE